MPGGARKSRDKSSCEPSHDKSKPARGSSEKQSTSRDHKKSTAGPTTEPGDKRRSGAKSAHAKPAISSTQPHVKTQRDSSRSSSCSEANSTHQGRAPSQSKAVLNGSAATYWDEQVRKQLLERKKEIVDKLMALIEECVEKKLEPLEEPCDGEGCSSRSHGSSSGKATSPSKRQSVVGKKRQLQRDDNDGNGSDNDDGSRRNRNNKRPKVSPVAHKSMYACPYYKRFPAEFGQQRTCCGPGWDDLHRLKEHLMRNHHLAEFQCERCCASFKKKSELVKHQRAVKPCPIRDPDPAPRNLADGFNNEKKEKLSKRTRNKPGHERWVEWYCLLFEVEPGSADIPSPYHGVPDSSDWREGHTNTCRHGPYVDFMRREIMAQARYAVEAEVEKLLRGCENPVLSNLRLIIPNIATSVHRTFESIPPPPGFEEEHGDSGVGNLDLTIPPGLDPGQLFAGQLFGEGFEPQLPAYGSDLNSLGNMPYFEDSSNTSDLSDGFHATTASSNTSVGEYANKDGQFSGQQRLSLPQQDSQLLLGPNYSYF